MNKFQPLDQVRSIVATALNRTAKVRKILKSFFIRDNDFDVGNAED